MSKVTGDYPDYSHPLSSNYFSLQADQPFNHQRWGPPINWEGSVGDKKVKFIQIDHSGSSQACFDWTGFPKKLESAKPYIVKAIDDAMRVMD